MVERLKVLVVENKDADANWLLSILQEIPMDSIRVKSFKEISKVIPQSHCDAILLSLNLPDLSGLNSLSKLKEQCPDIPIIVSVPEGQEEDAYEAVKNGAQGFIRVYTLDIFSVAAVIHQAFQRQNTTTEIWKSQRQMANLVCNLPGFVYRCRNDPDWTMEYISDGCKELTGYNPVDIVQNKKISYMEIIHPEDRKKVSDVIQGAVKKKIRFQVDYRILTASGGEKWVWEQGSAMDIDSDDNVLEGFVTDITDKKLREMQMQSVVSIGDVLRNSIEHKNFLSDAIKKISAIYQIPDIAIMLTTEKSGIVRLEAALGGWKTFVGREAEIKDCVSYSAIKENRIVTYDRNRDQDKICPAFRDQGSRYIGFIPLSTKRKTSGLIVISKKTPFLPHDLEAFKAIADMLASAIERSNLVMKVEKQLRRLESLHTIDQAITSVYEIKVVNKIILEQACKELGADAADILIFNSASNMLEYMGANGFLDRLIQNIRVPLTTSVAGKVLLENKDYAISNLEKNPLWFIRKNMQVENFRAYFAQPLSNKGEVVGVMEVFFRQPFFPDEEWNGFFEALATQAAVAYDSYRKYTDLQKIQQNMASSFRSTLETWSKSMELNEIESHGHIRRVTNNTIRLAREMGVAEEALLDIERGALLHDIGKIGIMDNILLKKGELSDEEWIEIKKHPQIARDLLHNVKLLENALDIPYSHHENWDGSGYPQGLIGNAIPLSARIFSVVETYDVLISDRPFRKPWSKEEAIRYLVDQKGKKFDPDVVDKFLNIIQPINN